MQASTTTLSSKFQISIPKAVREEQRWVAGQEFVFIPKGKGMLMMPVPELKQLRGIAKGADTRDVRDRKDRA
jgi:AbrB family looped-hinge helix DNA binding protein